MGARAAAPERGVAPILIVHSSDEMFGSDRMVLELIGVLSDADRARVVVWLPADYQHGATPLCDRLRVMGIAYEHVDLPVLRRRYLTVRGLAGLARRAVSIRRRLAQLGPSDVILATSATLPLAPLLRDRSTRVCLYLQEIWTGLDAKGLSALASRVDRVIAISEAARSSLPEHLRQRTVVVPNGTVEPDVYRPVDPEAGELVYLMAGRWDRGKGHDELLKAWDEAGSPGRLVIVGSPSELGKAVDVRGMVASSRRPETIDIRGKVADLGPVIDEADIMLLPSTHPEALGLVAIEAFAHGRAVVAFGLGGVLETVKDGAGWLVAPGDVGELAHTLGGLTRRDAVVAGGCARRRYEQSYSQAAFRAAMGAALAIGESDPRSAEHC
jgi:glycosyltransferase involved in cell wall biosynthesis